MNLGIDMDEVLADFHTSFIKYHNLFYGTSLTRDDFRTYHIDNTIGKSVEEAVNRVNDFHCSIYFQEITPIQDSVNSIDKLSQNNQLFVITSRPCFIEKETKMWLEKFFPGKFSGIFYSSNHYSGAKGKPKSQICQELEVSALIDDSLDYIRQCPAIRIKGILFGDYPWNKNGNLPPNITRAKNWKEVLENLL